MHSQFVTVFQTASGHRRACGVLQRATSAKRFLLYTASSQSPRAFIVHDLLELSFFDVTDFTTHASSPPFVFEAARRARVEQRQTFANLYSARNV